jgi:alpha-tubulin suppressor-like RCC1 family protein
VIRVLNFVLNIGETIEDVFAGYNTSYAITSSNRVFAWGENENSLIGNNSTTDSRLPINITSYFGDEVINNISANRYHALALSSSGKVFVWGENDYYITGDSSSFSRYRVPTDITDLFSSLLSISEKIVTIEASLKRSHFISSANRYFYMGNSSSQLTPVLQTTITNVNSLSYRYEHGIFWNTNNNTRWLWGPSSSWASWGTTTVFRSNERIRSADVGLSHTAFITTANRLFTFGNNSDYQLGNNSTTARGLSSSAQLTLPDLYQTETLIRVYAFENSTMVLTSYGRLFVFGNNDQSRLGVLNNASDIRTPSLNSQIFHQQLKVSIGHGTLISPNLPSNTLLNGYIFRGYFSNQNLTIGINNATIMPSYTFIIYGKWN